MGDSLFFVFYGHHHVFAIFVRLQGIDGDGQDVAGGIVLDLYDCDLVGADVVAVGDMDLYLERAVAGVDDLSGDVNRSYDLFVSETREVDLNGGADFYPFLVYFGDLNRDFQVVRIDDL